jgi:cation:H+ antiporter
VTTLLVVQLVGGLIWLLAGGDLLVRGAVALARQARVSPMIVALTIVAFGTSLPELVVVVRAALGEHPGLVLGNIVGSNTANVLLVAGAAGIVWPLETGGGHARRNAAIMIAASIGLVVLSTSGTIGPVGGALLLGGLVLMTLLSARDAHRESTAADDTPLEWVLGMPVKLGTITLFIMVGAVGLPLGANLVVESSVEIARQLGVSDALVGLTILAVSTSLPELATTLVAAFRRKTDVAVGAIVGSNIFNILGIMGVGAAVSPVEIPVADGFFQLDYPIMLLSAFALAVFVWRGKSIGRVTGVIFVAAYIAYVLIISLKQSGVGYF